MATKRITVEAAGLFSQVKGWLRHNLIAICNYWKGSYKDDGTKFILLNLCPSMFPKTARENLTLAKHGILKNAEEEIHISISFVPTGCSEQQYFLLNI